MNYGNTIFMEQYLDRNVSHDFKQFKQRFPIRVVRYVYASITSPSSTRWILG